MKSRYKSEPTADRSFTSDIYLNTIQTSPKKTLKLPKIKGLTISESEIEKVGEKVLKLKKESYDPKGCSKSIQMQKVLLKKKVNRKLTESQFRRKVERKSVHRKNKNVEEFLLRKYLMEFYV